MIYRAVVVKEMPETRHSHCDCVPSLCGIQVDLQEFYNTRGCR